MTPREIFIEDIEAANFAHDAAIACANVAHDAACEAARAKHSATSHGSRTMNHLETLRATLNDAYDYVIDAYAAAEAEGADEDAKQHYRDAYSWLQAARAAHIKAANAANAGERT